MNFDIEETIHGPARIAEMTGLSMDNQRNWRLRGYLGPSDGPRGKMRTSAVAALAVRTHAANLGYAARESEALGATAGPIVFYATLVDFPKLAITLHGTQKSKNEFAHTHARSDSPSLRIAGLSRPPTALTVTWRDNEGPSLTPQPRLQPGGDYEIALRQLSLAGIAEQLVQYAGQPLVTVRLE